MGRTFKPKYRLEIVDNTNQPNSFGWSDAYGYPNQKNLEKWVDYYNKSHQTGGVNFHISESVGVEVFIKKAKIIRQKDNVVMSEWEMPAFYIY